MYAVTKKIQCSKFTQKWRVATRLKWLYPLPVSSERELIHSGWVVDVMDNGQKNWQLNSICLTRRVHSDCPTIWWLCVIICFEGIFLMSWHVLYKISFYNFNSKQTVFSIFLYCLRHQNPSIQLPFCITLCTAQLYLLYQFWP